MSTTAAATRLTQLLRDRVGDNLRAVVAYWDREKVEIVHLREDVGEDASLHEREKLVQEFLIESFTKHTQERSFGLGELSCTVRYFQDATVLHFTLDEGAGVGVSLEPQATTVDRTFLQECQDVLETQTDELSARHS